MWDKVKTFFSSKAVKAVSWTVMFVDVASLVLGGATEADISDGLQLAMGAVGAVALLITFVNKKKS